MKKEDLRVHVQNEIQVYKSLIINEMENSEVYIPTAEEIATVRKLFNKYKLENCLIPLMKNIQSHIKTLTHETDVTGCIPFLNGILRLEDGMLNPYSKEDFVVTKLPFTFDIHFDTYDAFEFATSWFKSKEETVYVLQIVNNVLKGSNKREAYFCIGGGFNGKSFFGQLLKNNLEPLVKTIPGTFFCNNEIDSGRSTLKLTFLGGSVFSFF